MASKRQQTMAKAARERLVKERRERKQEKKRQRKLGIFEHEEVEGAVEGEATEGGAGTPLEGEPDLPAA